MTQRATIERATHNTRLTVSMPLRPAPQNDSLQFTIHSNALSIVIITIGTVCAALRETYHIAVFALQAVCSVDALAGYGHTICRRARRPN